MTPKSLLRIVVTSLSLLLAASRSLGQHADVLVQSVDGRLATGSADFDIGAWTLGARVYRSEFDGQYAVNNPGFNALASGSGAMPAGAAALPGSTPLSWDFLPMKIDGVAANLFYWNGATSTKVEFGPPPAPTYELALYGRNAAVGVDGAPELVPGDVIDLTASTGSIHRHRFFALDDGDGNPDTAPVDGIYLISLRLTMTQVDRSPPMFIVWGTPGSTLLALLAAESWVRDREAELAPDFDADFDGDLDVDGADFLTWQRGFAAADALQVQGDADRDDLVGAGDLGRWAFEFGARLASFPGAAAASSTISPTPEPTGTSIVIVPILAALGQVRARRLSASVSTTLDR